MSLPGRKAEPFQIQIAALFLIKRRISHVHTSRTISGSAHGMLGSEPDFMYPFANHFKKIIQARYQLTSKFRAFFLHFLLTPSCGGLVVVDLFASEQFLRVFTVFLFTALVRFRWLCFTLTHRWLRFSRFGHVTIYRRGLGRLTCYIMDEKIQNEKDQATFRRLSHTLA